MARARWTALAVVAALVIGRRGLRQQREGHGREEGRVRRAVQRQRTRLDAAGAGSRRRMAEKARASESTRPTRRRRTTSEAVLEQVSHEGNQLVIAHDSRYADAAEAVAKQTRVPELVWGERNDPPEGLVGQITVQDKEGGYMAGLVAAQGGVLEKTRDHRDRRRLRLGHRDLEQNRRRLRRRGAQRRSETSRSTTSRSARTATRRSSRCTTRRSACRSAGAQMIFALGGAATVGALRAVEKVEGEDQFVGVIGDKADVQQRKLRARSRSCSTRDRSSNRRVRDVRAGTFGEHPYALTLRNRGVWLFSTGRTPSDAYEAGISRRREDPARQTEGARHADERSRRGADRRGDAGRLTRRSARRRLAGAARRAVGRAAGADRRGRGGGALALDHGPHLALDGGDLLCGPARSVSGREHAAQQQQRAHPARHRHDGARGARRPAPTAAATSDSG